jgi:serine/threonine-protein kinase RsbW
VLYEKGRKFKMARRLDERTVEISLPNKIGYERIAMESSASFARISGFASERIEDLKTAVAEACLNAMEHGNKGRPDARVILTMDFKDDTLTVFVKDEGDGISTLPDHAALGETIENLKAPKGLGTYLIKQLVDHVEFNEMTEEGHAVKMVMKKERCQVSTFDKDVEIR